MSYDNYPEQAINPPEGGSLITQNDIDNEAENIIANEDEKGELTFIDNDMYLYDFASDTLAILNSTETDRADKLFDIERLRDKYQKLYLSGLVDTEYYQNKARSNLGVF